jgi:hypothetical protein
MVTDGAVQIAGRREFESVNAGRVIMDNMTTEQLVESLRALAEARAAGVVDETARIRFENACINTNFPALLEAVQGLVRENAVAASRYDFAHALLEAVEGLVRENRQLREQLIGPQKQPASVRQIEAQAKSVANQLAESVQAQSRDLTSTPHGDKSQKG